MTLEDGRRTLFWNKDSQILSEWAAEQKQVPVRDPLAQCELDEYRCLALDQYRPR